MQNYPVTANFQIINRPYEFTQEQVDKLCQMQDTLNTYIHPDWKSQGFNWELAIQDEIMEIHGHLGWKWWKENYNVGLIQENLRQVQLEVIDILHFVISDWIESDNYEHFTEELNGPVVIYPIACFLHHMQMHANIGRVDIVMNIWANLARAVGLTEQDIMETYTQKYVLNKFRQDHGYKDGSYCKNWILESEIDGVKLEDNEVLAFVVESIKNEGQDTSDETELYNRLEFLYNNRLNQ